MRSILRLVLSKFQIIFIALCFLGIAKATGQIVLETDFSNAANAKGAMHYHLDVYNRITPINGFNPPSNANGKICLVRPLGGVASNGAADLSKDSYKWNAATKSFYTDFANLKKQIDGVIANGFEVYHIVLDNPSWDFQRNADGTLPGGQYKVSTYGNAEPPLDNNAWARYLRDVMSFLVATYGRTEMLKVQFGIGREIGTSGHWTGSKDQFFWFYRRSVDAIQTILPGAKVGSHFLWGSSNHSWGPDFVRWCKINNVRYDFVGVSYYPFYHQAARTNFTEVYNKDFAVIKDIPEWNDNAKLEMHEFALIETLGASGSSYVSAPKAHQNSFMVGVMKMFYENNMHNLFQWGTGEGYSPARDELLSMKNNTYYRNSKSGTQKSSGNYVNAIFARNFSKNQYNVMAYNYNASPTSNVTETVNIKATIPVAGGTAYKYRLAIYNKTADTFTWTEWRNASTIGSLTTKSTVSLTANLPVFSFFKYEIIPSEVSLTTVVRMQKANATSFAVDGGIGGIDEQPVYLWDNNATNVNQQWVEIDRGGGYFSYQKLNTDYCIDGGNGGIQGQLVYLYTRQDANQNQHWKKISVGGGKFVLEKRNAVGFAIDGGNGGVKETQLKLWPINTSNGNQQWLFSNVSSPMGMKGSGQATDAFVVDGADKNNADILAEGIVAVYPNPATSHISLRGIANEKCNISIYDFTGKLMLTATQSQNISIANLPNGIYVLKLDSYDTVLKFSKMD